MSEKTVKDNAPKKSTYRIVTDTLKYFYPIAWKKYKGFFLCAAANIVFKSVQPFMEKLLSYKTPLLIKVCL